MGNRMVRKVFFFENGQLKSLGGYKNGVMEGRYVEFQEDGDTLTKAYFRKGKLNGSLVEYYPNGGIQRIMTYEDNVPSGLLLKLYDNGAAEMVGNQKNGKLHGDFEFYNKSGELTEIRKYNLRSLVTAQKVVVE